MKTQENNPNWKGGLLSKKCTVCFQSYSVKRVHYGSRYCSLKCVGVSQRGVSKPKKPPVNKACSVCGTLFKIAPSHASRRLCCSKKCSMHLRSIKCSGEANPNWRGGLSRKPYTWNFRVISKKVIARDGKCQNPGCGGKDTRLTTHHIDYDKQNNFLSNLICLCSSCNSRANFGRDEWQELYSDIVKANQKDGA